MTKENGKNKKIIKRVSLFIWGIAFICALVFGYFIYDANVLPFKYLLGIFLVLIIFLLIHCLLLLKKNTRAWLMVFLSLLSIMFIGVSLYASLKINDTIRFINENLGAYFETNIYHIVVNNESSYKTLDDIRGKEITIVKDMDDMSEVEGSLKRKVSMEVKYDEGMIEMLSRVSEDVETIILVNSGNYDAMVENDKEYEGKVRIVDTIEVKTRKENTTTGIDMTQDSFIVYLSGIDTRSGMMPSRSLSDVNILLAVNPNTHHILMVHVPRDYYVPVAGRGGARDKLTHTGTIGGVALTMQTLEEFLQVKLSYYVRVNFNSVINLVNAIGGINLYSDVDYSFTCWTNRSCKFNPGDNYVDGTCALAFARERYAYSTGDRHRGENQEQVITKVIDKITSSSTLISNYSDILNALNGTFETNITGDEITSLVRMQIDEMKGWNIESVNVTGTGSLQPTYSYPNQNLYVMNPDMESVNKAITRLHEVIEETN